MVEKCFSKTYETVMFFTVYRRSGPVVAGPAEVLDKVVIITISTAAAVTAAAAAVITGCCTLRSVVMIAGGPRRCTAFTVDNDL